MTYLMFEKARFEQLRSPQHRLTDTSDDSYRSLLANEAFELGNEAYKKRDFSGSLAHYGEALKHCYQSHETHNNIGVLKALTQDYKAAVDSLRVSLSIKPLQTISLINLANVYIKTKDFEDGFALYLRLMETNNSARAEESFNRILKSLNCFRRYYESYLQTCVAKEDASASAKVIKELTKNISYSVPIMTFHKLKAGEGAKIQKIYESFIHIYHNLPFTLLIDKKTD